ncbi:hypothetical protein [Haladaptatus sp. CMAA 1911]|uniref:hypothetical protein n=1 Tax=unclassified Haladaptatus TaxID=2622732 RepID=UPI0037545338
MTDKHDRWRSRRPRIDATDSRREHARRRLFDQLHAEIESLQRRLEEAEERIELLEARHERRERRIRSCSMCGRVATRSGPDARCPYCETGELERV